MGKKKMIENYQLLEVVGEVEDMYEIIKAKHIQEKKYYTLKKVKIKNDKNNRLYEGFLKEASLLKSIKHPNFAKSIKMLKTASSIYVVYDYCEGENLEQWMSSSSKRALTEKQGVIKQLCLVLAEMKKAGIAHLYLSPQCIFINDEGDIKVTDFMYGTDMPDNGQEIQLNEKIPKTDFTAPQVKKGTACQNSDIYSFGKLIDFIDVNDCKKGTLSLKQFNTKCEQYNQLIKTTTKKNPQERDEIQQVYKAIFKTKAKLKKMKSMSMSMSKVGGKDSMLSRSSQITTASGNNKGGEFLQELILKILKRRNMAKLLIEIFKNIIDISYINSTDLLILSVLLLKKSSLIMNSIAKFMKYGKGIPGLELNERQRNKFFKSSDYLKMQPLIQNETKTQKKQYESALQSIYLDNVKLLQIKRFGQQLKKQQMDENYLKQLMKEFVGNSVRQMELEHQQSSFLKSLYFMSQILEGGGVELYFEKKAVLFPVELSEQQYFGRVNRDMKQRDFLIELQKYKKAPV